MSMEPSDDVNLHDVEDYSSEVTHDQLPSVEEIRSQAHVTIHKTNRKASKPWYIALGVVVLTILVVAIAVPSRKNNQKGQPRGDARIGSNVERAIHLVSLNGRSDFDDSSSFQAISKRWLMDDDFVRNYTFDQLRQRYAMYVLYHATNVDNTWVDATGWKRKGMSECTWFGVTCDDDGLVTRIELRNNGLKGEIPREISLIPNLHLFNIRSNPELEGDITLHFCSLPQDIEVKTDCSEILSCGCCSTHCVTNPTSGFDQEGQDD